jgi:hypothetical protein
MRNWVILERVQYLGLSKRAIIRGFAILNIFLEVVKGKKQKALQFEF